MKPVNERLREFVDYHIHGDGECNAVVLKRWADEHKLSEEDRFDSAYFFSVTYCVESAIVLYANREYIRREPVQAAKSLSKEIKFQSDRRWVNIQNRFENVLFSWSKNRLVNISACYPKNGILMLSSAVKQVENWYYFKRFSAFLFLETFATLLDCQTSNTTIDWKNGDTATSGLLNVFCMDKEADEFDKTGVLCVDEKLMDELLDSVVEQVRNNGGDYNVTKIETSLCAYRKFYKGTRYNGYYLDRMLEELNLFRKHAKFDGITEELFRIRKQCFDKKVLGEYAGWNGIRKHLKKQYIRTGVI